MKVRNRIIEIYNNDFIDLIERLKDMTREERFKIYKSHTDIVFPKSKEIINLEDQIKGRSDYIHKFKRSFFIIGNVFFSSISLGYYHQENFIDMIGYHSQKYPQKVILALSMMGYITRMICKNSVGNHGYIFEVDYWRYKKWGDEFFVDLKFKEDETIDVFEEPEFGDDWLWNKQADTIRSMKVDDNFYKTIMEIKDECLIESLNVPKTDTVKLGILRKKLDLIHKIESLKYKKESCMRITVDGEDGRLYSIMTRMKSEVRKNGCITVEGERFREIDLCNSQPALFGLLVKKKHEKNHTEFDSLWLEHALKGDFYKWLIDLTGLNERPVDEILRELEETISKDRKSKKKKVIERADELNDVVLKVKSVKSDDIYKKLKPLSKHWIIKFLFSKQIVSPDERKVKSLENRFLKKIVLYLKNNETLLYEELMWYKKNARPKKKNPEETASELARNLQEEEVRFIKRCLKDIDPHIRHLYTVHDSIACLESDVQRVKSIMESTSMDFYGVKLMLDVS